MSLPQFNAEASLGPNVGIYRGKCAMGRSSELRVSPMLEKFCGNCEPAPGGLGGIRVCSQRVWKWNPATGRLELVYEHTTEGCIAERSPSRWWAF